MEKASVDTDRLATEKKRQQLAELLKMRAAQTQDRPLSLGQERIYRLTRLTPDAPLYNVACAYRLTGALYAGALERAVRRIEAQHDILRTTFPTVGEATVQRVAPARPDSGMFRRIDSSDAEAAITEEISRIIHLEAGPLWRLALILETAESHVLVLTMHHIVTDGWSFELFLRGLASLYGAAVEGGEAEPARLGPQYADFGERQRRALEDPTVVEQQTYWRAQLAQPEALALPTDRPAGPGTERAAESLFFSLPEALSQDLNALGQREGATLFMTLQVAFAALLNRATGQEKILFCAPVTGRHRAQSRELLGYFNNILPIQLDLSGTPSLVELVRRSRQVTLDAYKNQDVPFQWNAALPGLRRIPLSRLLFSLDMEWPPRLSLAGLVVEPLETETGAADFDLSVSLWLADGQIKGNLRYKTALFDRETVAAIRDAYAEILAAFVAEPDRSLEALPPLAIGRAIDEGQAAVGDIQVLPRSALEVRLAHLWEEALEKRPIGIRDDLASLGASSLAVAALAERVQHEFHTDLPITAIFRAGTVERLATLLQSRDERLSRSPLAPIQPHGTKAPLFLCEGVGIYYPLVPYLGDDRPMFGLVSEIAADYPRVEDLAAHYLEAVFEIQPEGPYHLGGVSFGGLVAFEMAQQLRAMGREVGLLLLLDTPGPGAFRPKGRAGRALGHAGNVLRYGFPYIRKKLTGKLRKRSGGQAPQGSRLVADPDEVRRLFHKVATDYRIRPYDGRIALFALNERGGMTNSLFDPALGHIDPLLGWGNVAGQGVDHYELDGEHVSILREPYAGTLGRQIRSLLEAEGAALAPT